MGYFFSLRNEVYRHGALNSSSGIVRYGALGGETEESIRDCLREQGVAAVRGFRVGEGRGLVGTGTLLLAFGSVVSPGSLKVFYRMVPVEVCMPGPLRCFGARGLDIVKATVLLILDRFVNDVEWEVVTIIPAIVQAQQDVLTTVGAVCRDPVGVRFGGKREKS